MVLMLAALLLAGCRRSAGPAPGEAAVEWRGGDRGRFTVAATATHCPETGVVEIIGIRGDTAVGIAVFLADSAVVGPGDYQVFQGATLVEPRPGATAGVRWFTGVDLAAFESVSGTVTVRATDNRVSGALAIRMQGVSSSDTLAVTGTMNRLPVNRSGPGCGRTSRRNIR
jgi:hypothetical protein